MHDIRLSVTALCISDF